MALLLLFPMQRMIDQTLLVYHCLQQILGRLELVPRPVEHHLTDGFLLIIVQPIKIRMTYFTHIGY